MKMKKAPEFVVLKRQTINGIPGVYEHWYPCEDSKEVNEMIENEEKPGLGQEYDTLEFLIFSIKPELVQKRVVPRLEMTDIALPLVPYDYNGCTSLGKHIKVDVALKGKAWDGPAVFWTNCGNSFAIVKPPDMHPIRLVSRQGVILVSINGIGEIRWDVDKQSADYRENQEAVAHFGLTWD